MASNSAVIITRTTRLTESTILKDLLDLVGVVQVVTRVQADDVLDGLCTTLGMYPLVLPLFRRQCLEHLNIHFAEHAEELDGFSRVASIVVPSGKPSILIECLNRGSGRGGNRSEEHTSELQ